MHESPIRLEVLRDRALPPAAAPSAAPASTPNRRAYAGRIANPAPSPTGSS